MTWFAIRTATRREKDAKASLQNLGINVFLPCEAREYRHARKCEIRTYPLLSGYLFADLTSSDISRVLDADFIHNILGAPKEHGDRGQPVSAHFIAWLAAHEHMGAFNRTPWTPDPTFPVGRKVRVAKGKLTGALGLIMEARGDKRVIVALELFGRTKPVNLGIAELEAA